MRIVDRLACKLNGGHYWVSRWNQVHCYRCLAFDRTTKERAKLAGVCKTCRKLYGGAAKRHLVAVHGWRYLRDSCSDWPYPPTPFGEKFPKL